MVLGDTVSAVLSQKSGWLAWVSPQSSVYEALELMAEHDIGALMVLSQGRLRGMFTERDYARKLILLGKSSKETTVGEIMSSPVLTVRPSTEIETCMHLMTLQRIRYLPVVDGAAIEGILSIGDVVNWTIRRQGEEIEHLNHYIAGAYPA
ncbi:MAG: CBS domain-containing protein [Bryobacteraceae bacterium]